MRRKALDAYLLEPAKRDEFRDEAGWDSFFEPPTHIAVGFGPSHARALWPKCKRPVFSRYWVTAAATYYSGGTRRRGGSRDYKTPTALTFLEFIR